MSYSYEVQRKNLFTEEGQRLFLSVRDDVQRLLKVAGAFRQDHVRANGIGAYDSWDFLACFDRLVELKEIVVLPRPSWAQYTVYSSSETHCR